MTYKKNKYKKMEKLIKCEGPRKNVYLTLLKDRSGFDCVIYFDFEKDIILVYSILDFKLVPFHEVEYNIIFDMVLGADTLEELDQYLQLELLYKIIYFKTLSVTKYDTEDGKFYLYNEYDGRYEFERYARIMGKVYEIIEENYV